MDKQQRFNNVVKTIKKWAKADDFTIQFYSTDRELTRFANNMATQNISILKESVSYTAYFDKKKATLSSADITEESIKNLVEKTENVARQSVEDKEYLPSLSESISEIPHHVADSALLSPETRSQIVQKTVSQAQAEKVLAFGAISNELQGFGIAAKNGMQNYYESSLVDYTNTVDINGEKGSSFCNGFDLKNIDTEKTFQEALNDAQLLQNRQEYEPGRYDVLFSAQAATKLFVWLFYGLDRRAADEGYSPYSEKIGQTLIDERLSFYTDPQHPIVPSAPFDGDGLPVSKTAFIENGILKNLPCSRFWAQKKSLHPIRFSNFILTDGENSEEELLSKLKDGFYIKDLWYIRMVKPENLTLTGMTRNGFFRVKDGKIVGGATHFRWNDSPLRMLKNIAGIGKGVANLDSWFRVFTPALLVKDFYLSSKTLF